jgi:hypothetical protein
MGISHLTKDTEWRAVADTWLKEVIPLCFGKDEAVFGLQPQESGLKLWLDDRRKPPWGYDLWAKTAKEAIEMLERHGRFIVHCSLDHDLADEHYASLLDEEPGVSLGRAPAMDTVDRSKFVEQTGYAVLEWMHEHDAWVPDISVHTLNPKGGQDMMRKLENRAPAHVKFRRTSPAEV